MKKLSVSEATKEARVSRATLWRAIKEGRISVTRTDNNEVHIDPVELFRVFEPRSPTLVLSTSGETTSDDSRGRFCESELDALRQLIKSHETTIKVQDDAIKDFRDRLMTSERRLELVEQERRAVTQTLTALLTHQNSSQKTSSASKWVVVTFLAVLLVAGVTFFLLNKSPQNPSGAKKPPTPTESSSPSGNPSSATSEAPQNPN